MTMMKILALKDNNTRTSPKLPDQNNKLKKTKTVYVPTT